VASKVADSQILFDPVQTGIKDFLRSSLTDGGLGGREERGGGGGGC